MNPNEKVYSIDNVARVAEKIRKRDGLFVGLTGVYDKDTMKWILVKFLKESLEFLSESEDARKTQRGKLVENWIDENLSLPGEYDRPKI